MLRFTLFCLGLLAYSGMAQSPLRIAHAHNDYEHAKPFYEAYQAGFGSIEVDVYAVQGGLWVSHDRKDLRPERTFERLYLNPILAEIKKGKPKQFHQLLVDIKTPADSTLPLLVKVLAPHGPKLLEAGILIVISGNRPPVARYADYPAWIGFDGRPNEMVPPALAHKVPLESEAMHKFGLWNGQSPMPAALVERLKKEVERVHAAGRKLRLWASPEGPLAYETLHQLGLDYIGTDQIQALANYLTQSSSKP